MASIAVLGAGAVGLSTAYSLKLADEHYDVTLIAEQKWFTVSAKWYNDILKCDYSNEAGISRISGYQLFDHKIDKLNLWGQLLPDGRLLNEEELKRFDPTIVNWKKSEVGTICDSFQDKGGKVVKKKIHSFEELSNFDVVVNCTGLGSRELCDDTEVIPMRGQVMRVEAPWIRHFYHVVKTGGSYPIYMYPNVGDMVVGGTYEYDNSEITEKDKEIILNNAINFEPSLKHAKVKQDWVGFRPIRKTLRLEIEDMSFSASDKEKEGKTKKLKVVHNYGHGPSGITFSWGTAQEAVQLVKECFRNFENEDEKSHVKSKL
eukprot:gene290-916_t